MTTLPEWLLKLKPREFQEVVHVCSHCQDIGVVPGKDCLVGTKPYPTVRPCPDCLLGEHAGKKWPAPPAKGTEGNPACLVCSDGGTIAVERMRGGTMYRFAAACPDCMAGDVQASIFREARLDRSRRKQKPGWVPNRKTSVGPAQPSGWTMKHAADTAAKLFDTEAERQRAAQVAQVERDRIRDYKLAQAEAAEREEIGGRIEPGDWDEYGP